MKFRDFAAELDKGAGEVDKRAATVPIVFVPGLSGPGAPPAVLRCARIRDLRVRTWRGSQSSRLLLTCGGCPLGMEKPPRSLGKSRDVTMFTGV